MSRQMNIGEAAEAAGVSAKMIRHYEQIGLVPAATRTDSGYRQYTDRDVSILRFIRQSRQLGFSIQQIAELLGLWSDTGRTSRTVKALAQQHVADLDRRMREMAEMKDALERLVESCAGNDHPECRILEGLATGNPAASMPKACGAPAAGATRRKAACSQAAAHPQPAADSATHLELMAWTRNIRQEQRQAR